MKVNSSFRYIDKQKPNQSFKGIPKRQIILPDAVGRIAMRAGTYINTPEQKLFLAASTLTFAPALDLIFADEDKKTDTAIKTASKAIAGGLTGVTIRAAFQGLTKKLIDFDAGNMVNILFFPKPAKDLYADHMELAMMRLDSYRKTLGTLFAVVFMILFSNSKVDVPLTGDIQDLLSGVIKDRKSWISSLADVAQNRKDKITAWAEKKKRGLITTKNKIVSIVKIIKGEDVNFRGDKNKT